MAQKKGRFNRFLEIIGLVDDAKDDDYDDGYQQQQRAQASRPSTYVPPHSGARTEAARQKSVLPDDRYAQQRVSRNTYDYNEGYTIRQSGMSARGDYQDMQDERMQTPRRTQAPTPAPRQQPKYNQAPAPTAPAPAPAARGNVGTAMFTLHSLEECCDVIQSLIENNVVLVSLDELDSRYTQRAVDTLSGAAYALGTTVRKASEKTYLIAPRNVRVNDTFGSGRY